MKKKKNLKKKKKAYVQSKCFPNPDNFTPIRLVNLVTFRIYADSMLSRVVINVKTTGSVGSWNRISGGVVRIVGSPTNGISQFTNYQPSKV